MMDQDNPVAKPPEASVMDWDLCALCQQASPAALICPAKRNGDGYKYIADNLKGFIHLDISPIPVNLALLDEGCGIERTLTLHSAQWHKSCRQKVSNKIRKRKLISEPPVSPKKTRRARDVLLQDACFF